MVGETAKRKRRPFPALLVMLMIVLRTTRCGATTSIVMDNATSPYLGRMDEPDWMFDSEISRMLLDKAHLTPDTLKGNDPVLKCAYYKDCLPPRRPAKPGENCDAYTKNRSCPV
jgi:hypothetical protein